MFLFSQLYINLYSENNTILLNCFHLCYRVAVYEGMALISDTVLFYFIALIIYMSIPDTDLIEILMIKCLKISDLLCLKPSDI